METTKGKVKVYKVYFADCPLSFSTITYILKHSFFIATISSYDYFIMPRKSKFLDVLNTAKKEIKEEWQKGFSEDIEPAILEIGKLIKKA